MSGAYVLSRETIAEIKAALDRGESHPLIWYGYSTDLIFVQMILYELEDWFKRG